MITCFHFHLDFFYAFVKSRTADVSYATLKRINVLTPSGKKKLIEHIEKCLPTLKQLAKLPRATAIP